MSEENPYSGGSSPYPGGGSSPEPPSPGPSTENKRLLQRYVQYVIDGENAELADHYFAVNFYNHDRAPGEEPGLVGVKAFLQAIYAAFSEFRTSIDEQIAEDDLVVGRWSQQFTNTGPYLNFPATGRSVKIGGITITRVRNGKIVEEWEARDAVSLLQQMGVLPALGDLEPYEGADGSYPGGAGVSEEEMKAIVRRWFDAVNSGDVDVFDEVMSYDVVDHSALNAGHGGGCEGHKRLVTELRNTFPEWRSEIDEMTVEGDKVIVSHTGRGIYPEAFRDIMGQAPADPEMRKMDFQIVSTLRIADGKIVEHWASQGPFGMKGGPGWPEQSTAYQIGDTNNTAVVKRYLYDIWNGGNLDLIDQVFAPDFVNHQLMAGQAPGRDGIRQFIGRLRSAFPDISVSVDLTVAEGNRVVVRWTFRGTHRGVFLGISPTNKHVTVTGISIFAVDGGLITEGWGHWERASLLEQLGVIGWPQQPGPYPGGAGVSEEEMKAIVRRWFDAVNSGDVDVFDEVMSYDVVDHSALNAGHGGGCEGHKRLVTELRNTFPEWRSEIDEMTVEGDKVIVSHTGRGIYPEAFRDIMGQAPADPEMRKMDFQIVSTLRIADGKIVEHWASQGPFGMKGGPGWPEQSTTGEPTGGGQGNAGSYGR